MNQGPLRTILPWTKSSRVYNIKSRALTTSFNQEYDPTTRVPTKKCDPYGQEGMPLEYDKAASLMSTLHPQWALQFPTLSKPFHSIENDAEVIMPRPLSLYREFYHSNFIDGSKFLALVAAIAHNNNHFPEVLLKRRLRKDAKAWEIVSTVDCYTPTLKGLSHHDFHLALMVDVETVRIEHQRLFIIKS